jgi:hypothetical protein
MINSAKLAEQVLGNQLTFVQAEDGTVYVPLKRLCETLKIDYEGQRSKVRNNEELHTELLSVPGTDGRSRKVLCLPLEAIGDWASTIDPRTLKPEVVEALTDLLEECDEVSAASESRKANAKPLLVLTPDELSDLMWETVESILMEHTGPSAAQLH